MLYPFKISVLICFILFLIPDSGHSCSCGKVSLRKQVKLSELVFIGTVKAIEPFGNRQHFKVVTFKVLKLWKAPELQTEIQIVAFDISDACGYPFLLGKSYLVFDAPGYAKAENTHPYPSTHLCTRTGSIEDAVEDIRKLGKPKMTIHRIRNGL